MTRTGNIFETWTDINSVRRIRFPDPKHKNNRTSPSFFFNRRCMKTIRRNLLLQQYKDIKRFEKCMSPLSKRVLWMKIARIFCVNTNPWTFRFRAMAICEKRSIERMQRPYCNTQATGQGGWGGTVACPARIIGFSIPRFLFMEPT
jgi:hypothetical protein